MSSRRRDMEPLGPETTISTPSGVDCARDPLDPVRARSTNATIDPCFSTPTKSSATPATRWRVVTA
jgi:hypothetical protein